MSFDPDLEPILSAILARLDALEARAAPEPEPEPVPEPEPQPEPAPEPEVPEGIPLPTGGLDLKNQVFNPPRVYVGGGGPNAYVDLEDVSGVEIHGATMKRFRGLGDISDVTLKRNTVAGAGMVGGIDIRGGTNRRIAIIENVVTEGSSGIVVFGGEDLEVVGNRIDGIVSDSMKFGGIKRGRIAGNLGSTDMNRTSETHPDFIQFQGVMIDVVIEGNVSSPAPGNSTQGIFEGTVANYPHERLVIRNNFLVGSHANQIVIKNGTGIVIEDNTVLTPAEGDARNIVWIKAPSGAVVQRNVSIDRPANAGVGANMTLQKEKPGQPFYAGDYLSGWAAGGRLDPASVIAPDGYGAKITQS